MYGEKSDRKTIQVGDVIKNRRCKIILLRVVNKPKIGISRTIYKSTTPNM